VYTIGSTGNRNLGVAIHHYMRPVTDHRDDPRSEINLFNPAQ
jgi:hypothetical protein